MARKPKRKREPSPFVSAPSLPDVVTVRKLEFAAETVNGKAAYRITGERCERMDKTPMHDLLRVGVLHDLLGLDVSDDASVDAFMLEHGLSTSLARVSPFFPNSNPCVAVDIRDDVMLGMTMLYMPEKGEGGAIDETARMGGRFVSRREAVCALSNCRAAVRALVDAKIEGGYPKPSTQADLKLNNACRYASCALSRFMPVICQRRDEYLEGGVPALAVALADAVRVALDPEPVKHCKHCGALFQYQKIDAPDRPMKHPERPRRKREPFATFCTKQCRIDHNNAKQPARRAAKKAAERNSETAT